MRKPQLFILHFAGGNSHSFNFLTPYLKEFEVISLDLPGRGRRSREILLNDFNLAAQDFYTQIKNKLSTDKFLIFGHSMGAYLTLKVAGLLEQDGKAPSNIVVSGNAGPGILYPIKRYLLQGNEFTQELKKLGGIPTEVLENKELMEYFEPILRADLQIAETNDLENEPAINVPMYALMGSEESQKHRISNWERFTNSSFQYEILEGDHFFIYKHPEKIAQLLTSLMKDKKIGTGNNTNIPLTHTTQINI